MCKAIAFNRLRLTAALKVVGCRQGKAELPTTLSELLEQQCSTHVTVKFASPRCHAKWASCRPGEVLHSPRR